MAAVINQSGGESTSDVWGRKGLKRAADEATFSDFERFEKRLRRLTLREQRNGTRQRRQLYSPVSKHEAHAPTPTNTNGKSDPPRAPEHDAMHLDSTPNRIYIHDLDAELASDSESDGERLIFLPDIEKRFSRLPHQVLQSSASDTSQEMVLYSVPQSLTVDAEHDSVRKAIIEARARAREKAALEERARQEGMERMYDQSDVGEAVERAHGVSSGYASGSGGMRTTRDGGWQLPCEDAMDLD